MPHITLSYPQVVWTAGDKSLLLWCAFSGLFLGSIYHKDEPDELDALQYESGRKGHRKDREMGEHEEKKRIDSKKVGLWTCQKMSWSCSQARHAGRCRLVCQDSFCAWPFGRFMWHL